MFSVGNEVHLVSTRSFYEMHILLYNIISTRFMEAFQFGMLCDERLFRESFLCMIEGMKCGAINLPSPATLCHILFISNVWIVHDTCCVYRWIRMEPVIKCFADIFNSYLA